MIEVITIDRIEEGVQRLLVAPLDLIRCGVTVCPSGQDVKGTDEHRVLFADYDEILEVVTDVALEYWGEIIEAAVQHSDDAIRESWINRPAGPASYPGLVALIRDYWLLCDEINRRVDVYARVPPEVFLLSWLCDGKHVNQVKVLSCMPYWPIGLDLEGNWV